MSKKEQNPAENDPTDSSKFEGFNIKINEFGEVICSHSMDDINDYLDVNIEDKKLSIRKGNIKK